MAHPDEEKRADTDVVEVPVTTYEQEQEVIDIDESYLHASKFTKFFRGILLQMILFGCLSFVGPAMTDSINLLGGGGFASPYLANIASAINYAASCLMSLFGGPLINKLGIKYSCMLSGACFFFSGTGYYLDARYGSKMQGYFFASRFISGITNAFLYVAEATAMISYPTTHDRGKYLGIWTAMRNLGSLVGGGINYGTNYGGSTAGSIAWSTYLVFIGFESSGIIFASLLSPTRKVRRPDGTCVPISNDRTWKAEMVALVTHLRNPRTWLLFFPAFYSFFYGGTYSTYLTLHFSVRSRALSSILTPTLIVTTVLMFGLLLDNKRWTPRQRAWIGLFTWLIPQCAAFIWTGVNYGRWGQNTKTYHAYDFLTDKGAWAVAYLPYLIQFVTGYWCQMYIYWVLGTFSTDAKSSSRTGGLFRAFEAAGSAVTYSINTAATDKRICLYVNCAILVAAVPCLVALIRMVPEKPKEVDDVVGGEPAPILAAVQKTQNAEDM